MTFGAFAIECLSGAAPLAQMSNWRRLGDKFSGSGARLDQGEILTLVAVFVAGFVGIALLHWASRRQEDSYDRPNPGRLFRELCRAHGLVGQQRRTLKKLAEATGVAQPAELFLRAELFDPDNLPDELQGRVEVIAGLREALFGDVAGLTPGAAAPAAEAGEEQDPGTKAPAESRPPSPVQG